MLGDLEPWSWPPGWVRRRGGIGDLETAARFDALIDLAHGLDPSAWDDDQTAAARVHVREFLEDPESSLYLLEVDGTPVAQCITFALPPLRGAHPDTLYLGSVAVDPTWRRRGVARALVSDVLAAAHEDFAYAEVRWHIDNAPATAFWSAMGFRPTYLQMRREFDDVGV